MEVLNFNIYNVLIFCGAIHGLLFAIAIFFTKKFKSTSNYYLAQVVLYLSLNTLFYWFADTKVGFRYKYFYNIYIPWILLVLPYYYFFVSEFLNQKISSKTKHLLKTPFYISFIIHLFLSINKIVLDDFFHVNKSFVSVFYIAEEFVAAIFTFWAIYKVYKIIFKYRKDNSDFKFEEVKVKTSWILKVLNFGLIICSIWFLLLIYNYFNELNFFNNNGKYFLWGTSSILIYWMGYLGVYHNGIFKERAVLRANISPIVKEVVDEQKSTLNKDKFIEIDTAIKNEKLFLNPNLSLLFLVEYFNLSEGYLSQLINEFSGGNLSTYINKLRVEQAKIFLQNPDFEKYTIVSIALESGFNSKSTFYNAFKKITGISPTEYKVKSLS